MPYKLGTVRCTLGTVRCTIYVVQWRDECAHMVRYLVRYRSIFGAVLRYCGKNLVGIQV